VAKKVGSKAVKEAVAEAARLNSRLVDQTHQQAADRAAQATSHSRWARAIRRVGRLTQSNPQRARLRATILREEMARTSMVPRAG
jgi:hypothetical protein